MSTKLKTTLCSHTNMPQLFHSPLSTNYSDEQINPTVSSISNTTRYNSAERNPNFKLINSSTPLNQSPMKTFPINLETLSLH